MIYGIKPKTVAERRIQVAKGIAAGMTMREIADALKVSLGMVHADAKVLKSADKR